MISAFEQELEQLINAHSQEQKSDTPDFILAEYMRRCLEVFGEAVRRRDEWWGKRSPKMPSRKKKTK